MHAIPFVMVRSISDSVFSISLARLPSAKLVSPESICWLCSISSMPDFDWHRSNYLSTRRCCQHPILDLHIKNKWFASRCAPAEHMWPPNTCTKIDAVSISMLWNAKPFLATLHFLLIILVYRYVYLYRSSLPRTMRMRISIFRSVVITETNSSFRYTFQLRNSTKLIHSMRSLTFVIRLTEFGC